MQKSQDKQTIINKNLVIIDTILQMLTMLTISRVIVVLSIHLNRLKVGKGIMNLS